MTETEAQRPLIMGIINVTPDSFSGDGLLKNPDALAAALHHAEHMLEDGADILDIGGESTRPGSTPIDAAEEIRRVVPLIEMLRAKHGAAPVLSVALQAGANMINDVSALSDPAMGVVVARYKCPVVLMHNRSEAGRTEGESYKAPAYTDLIADIKFDLRQSVNYARSCGIADSNIILDPGIGFGKNAQQNMALIKHVTDLKSVGFPLLLGPSRKSFIGKVLDVPAEERLEGTAACIAIATYCGADIVRVHDVKFMSRVARMASEIKRS